MERLRRFKHQAALDCGASGERPYRDAGSGERPHPAAIASGTHPVFTKKSPRAFTLRGDFIQITLEAYFIMIIFFVLLYLPAFIL
jgi:hypothetical protein